MTEVHKRLLLIPLARVRPNKRFGFLVLDAGLGKIPSDSLDASPFMDVTANGQSRANTPESLPESLAAYCPAVLGFVRVVFGRGMRYDDIGV